LPEARGLTLILSLSAKAPRSWTGPSVKEKIEAEINGLARLLPGESPGEDSLRLARERYQNLRQLYKKHSPLFTEEMIGRCQTLAARLHGKQTNKHQAPARPRKAQGAEPTCGVCRKTIPNGSPRLPSGARACEVCWSGALDEGEEDDSSRFRRKVQSENEMRRKALEAEARERINRELENEAERKRKEIEKAKSYSTSHRAEGKGDRPGTKKRLSGEYKSVGPENKPAKTDAGYKYEIPETEEGTPSSGWADRNDWKKMRGRQFGDWKTRKRGG
jgi:hypothetical protein